MGPQLADQKWLALEVVVSRWECGIVTSDVIKPASLEATHNEETCNGWPCL